MPLTVTVLPFPTDLDANVVEIPVTSTVTTSPVITPENAAPVLVTFAEAEASYVLLLNTRPPTVRGFAEMEAVRVGWVSEYRLDFVPPRARPAIVTVLPLATDFVAKDAVPPVFTKVTSSVPTTPTRTEFVKSGVAVVERS